MSCRILSMNRLRRLQWGRLAGRRGRGDWGWSMINPTATITHCKLMAITERRSLISTTETELFKQHFNTLLFFRIAFRQQKKTFFKKLHPLIRSGLPPYLNLLKANFEKNHYADQCPVSRVRVRTFKKRQYQFVYRYSILLLSWPIYYCVILCVIYLVGSRSGLF